MPRAERRRVAGNCNARKARHEKFTSPVIASYWSKQSENEDDEAMMRVARRDYEKATKVRRHSPRN